MNIAKQLTKIAESNSVAKVRNAETILDSVKANLQMEDQRDLEMLSYFGTRDVVVKQRSQLKKAHDLLKSATVGIEDIKRICLSYSLRFLRSSYYKKEIPMAVLNDLRNYQEESEIMDTDLSENLFVIAPASHFTLGERPKKDPVLLHRVGERYRVVSKWGSDFSPLRRVYGFIARYPNVILILSFFFIANLISILSVTIWNGDGTLFILNVGIIFSVLLVESPFGSSDDNWNTPYKI